MPAALRKPGAQAVQAEVSLLSQKNCLVNLPASLVALLVNANTVAQNVVVELNWRQPVPPAPGHPDRTSTALRSVFVGWTGMQSKNRISPVIGRDGFTNSRDQDIPQVEIDGTFARLLGLASGQKVGLLLHMDPPQAHTINIEPLTAADWEMIELHAKFLELNFLSQVRALPNPSFSAGTDRTRQSPHPVTLHLSPTSTVNVVVTSLAPTPPATSPFVKISPDAEVIVAPKTRERVEYVAGRPSRSVVSAGRRSTGGRSRTSTVRHRNHKTEESSRAVLFLRGIDRSFCDEYFNGDDAPSLNSGLVVWMSKEHMMTGPLKGARFASISIIKPAGLLEPADPSKEQDSEKPALKIVASIRVWEDAFDSNHIAISTALCTSMASRGLVGGLVRVEAAPLPISRHATSASGAAANSKVRRQLRVLPFVSPSGIKTVGLKFGGESKQERDASVQRLRTLFSRETFGSSLFDGPLTHGMMLPTVDGASQGWYGGILKFDPPPSSASEGTKSPPGWILGSDWTPAIEMQSEIPRPIKFLKGWAAGEAIPSQRPELVGIDPGVHELTTHLSNSSSVLLVGGAGAGKTGLAYVVAHDLRDEFFYNITYLSCRTLATNDTRASAIKDTLNRLFGAAAWGARLGGRSLIILDDLDRLCPAETELQVGDENGRSRQVSESLCAAVRQYCTPDSGVVMLATAQSKEAVNNVVVGGHVVREILSLKAPSKHGRRLVLEKLVQQPKSHHEDETLAPDGPEPSARSRHSSTASDDGRPVTPSIHEGFVVDKHIDFLDIAGQTDGYMPGDLVLLVYRARSEALIRTLADTSSDGSGTIGLIRADFAAALKGFTPASLRNVTLQSSTTKWSSIGGLQETRQALMETLQYPTTYAPIFSKCPLRLRSGLLLYGYPGCGKTLLASAVAGECGLNFISVKGPEILNKYIGASEKSVRDLFERAQAARPCVLFFDEFDAIAPKRGHDSTGVTDRVVNQLLTQMDGAEGLSGVYVLAATSRPDLIDPALLRPGRLDKSLVCEMPNQNDRLSILKAVSAKVRFSEQAREFGMDEVARQTEGYSGADLQAVVYNAQLEAIHDVLGDDDFTAADQQTRSNGASSSTKSAPRAVPDFIYFRYGDTTVEPANGDAASAADATERIKIAQHLGSMQAARRRERQQRQLMAPSHRPSSSYSNRSFPSSALPASDADQPQPGTESKEPVIQWEHLKKSLDSTRASISPDERKRLARIYREFVEGRTGDLPNGQGGSEIGGRASLM